MKQGLQEPDYILSEITSLGPFSQTQVNQHFQTVLGHVYTAPTAGIDVAALTEQVCVDPLS